MAHVELAYMCENVITLGNAFTISIVIVVYLRMLVNIYIVKLVAQHRNNTYILHM